MEVIVPESIKDITLEQYQKLTKLVAREDLTESEFKKRLISVFTNIKYNDTGKVSKRDFDKLVEAINTAINTDCEFQNTFELNGVTYGFIPNLDNVSGDEWFDAMLYPMEEDDKLHKAMAVLFREVRKKKDMFGNYRIKPYNGTTERSELFKQMPMHIVNGARGFFLTLLDELQAHTLKSTRAAQAREAKQQTTLKNGDGMQHSTT